MKSIMLIAATAVMLATPAHAGEFQDLGQLEARVAASLADAGSPVPIDRRIKLAKCPVEPSISGVMNGFVAVRCATLGWRLAVGVSAPESIADKKIEVAVRRGDVVELIARGSGFSVTSTGVALDEGVPGKAIRVKMPTGSAPVRAIITGPGAASIAY